VSETPACDESSANPFLISLYTISAGQHGIEVPIELNNQFVSMELDTGAGISIISEETYNTFFKDIPLEPSTTKLHAYTGAPHSSPGTIQCSGPIQVPYCNPSPHCYCWFRSIPHGKKFSHRNPPRLE